MVVGAGTVLPGCSRLDLSLPPPTAHTVPTVPPTTSTTTKVIVNYGKCRLGVPVTFAPGLRMLVAAPTHSTGPLGTGNGYPPRYGYYITFQVTASNVGTQQVDIYPGFTYASTHSGFVVDEAGDNGVTVNSGNTPFDGSITTLDMTYLNPGNKVGPAGVTFDVPHLNGQLTYFSSGHLICTWQF